MLTTRVMPCLLLDNSRLVKTVKFKNPKYIGDPINTVKIYNEKEVDELIFLDITASIEKRKPPFEVIAEIASECFMPFGYGGGITNIEDAKQIFRIGVEKLIISSYAIENPRFIQQAADKFGNQSIVVCINVKKNLFGKYEIYQYGNRKRIKIDPVSFAVKMEEMGAGEILLNSIDRDGTWAGYDIDIIKKVSKAVNIPLVACGGASELKDFNEAVNEGGAAAVAAGSKFVYQGKDKGVLINFPTQVELERLWNS